MRILLVCHGLPPDSVGGVEQHVGGLMRELVSAGHEVEVFARWSDAGRAQGDVHCTHDGNPRIWRVAYRWEGVDSLEAMYSCRPMAAAMQSFLASRRADGVRFDVAHVHHLTGMSVDALAALRDAGTPVVMTLHDYWLFCPRGQMFHHQQHACETASVDRCGPCLQATFPWWLGDADRDAKVATLHQRARDVLAIPHRLVVPSARVVPAFAALGIAEQRFQVVENGVDTDHLSGLPDPAFGPGPLRVGYFGTVMPSKGLDVLIAALQLLPRGLAELRVHGNVVPYHGDESYATRCLSPLQPGTAFSYHGPYTPEDLPARMATVDVVAAPAKWHEAFGLTVREGLAAGRPVLVSRVGGLQDAVVDGVAGRVLPPGEPAAWAAAIRQLAEDRALARRMSAAARGRARGFRAMADDLAAVYRAVTGSA